jgi:hypothetical protein
MARLDASHQRMVPRMDSKLETVEACLGMTGATDLQANPKEIESEAEHEHVPKEESTVETFGALKERHRDHHLTVRRCGQPKKRTQGNSTSRRKKFAAACKGMTRHAVPAQSSGTRPE